MAEKEGVEEGMMVVTTAEEPNQQTEQEEKGMVGATTVEEQNQATEEGTAE